MLDCRHELENMEADLKRMQQEVGSHTRWRLLMHSDLPTPVQIEQITTKTVLGCRTVGNNGKKQNKKNLWNLSTSQLSVNLWLTTVIWNMEQDVIHSEIYLWPVFEHIFYVYIFASNFWSRVNVCISNWHARNWVFWWGAFKCVILPSINNYELMSQPYFNYDGETNILQYIKEKMTKL